MMLKKVFILILLSLSILSSINAQNRAVKMDASTQYEQATSLFNDKQYNAAQHLFEAYLNNADKESVNGVKAQYYSALCAIYLFQVGGENQIKRFVDKNSYHPKAKEAYFRLGNFYYREKNYAKAIQYYQMTSSNILSKADLLDYQFRTGYAYFSRKAFEEAKPFFNQLKRSNNSYQSAAYYYSAYVNYELKNYQEALADINEASKNDAYASSAAEIRANVYYKQAKYQEVIDYITSLGPNKMASGTMLIAADAYFELKNYEEALRYFMAYEKTVKVVSSRSVLYRMGYAAYKTNEVPKAINFLEKVGIEKDSLTQYSTYYLGSLYQKEGNTRFAINAFQQARGFNFDQTIKEESQWQLSVLLIKEASYEQAIKELLTFLELFPKSSHSGVAKEYLTNAYLNTQAYDLAISFIESQPFMSTKLKKIYQQLTFYQGADLFNKANYFEAVASFQKSVNYPLSKEINAEAYFWMGESYATARKYVESIKAYEKSVSITLPSNEWYPALCYGLAYSYYNTKVYASSLNYFSKYVGQNKDRVYMADAYMRKADCHYVLKQYAQAKQSYSKAISLGGIDAAYVTFQLGIVSSLENKENEAIEYFDKLIANYKSSNYYDNALFQKSLLTFETGNYERSVALFTDMMAKVPQSNLIPYALSKRAIAFFNLKNYDASLTDYRKILSAYITHPTASGALLGLQEIYGIKNVEGDFEAYLAKYQQANPEDKEVASIEYDAAKSLYFNQNYDRAVIAFKNYLENYPDNNFSQEATYYMADSYYRADSFDQSLPIFKRVIADEQSQFMKRAVAKIAEIELAQEQFQSAGNSFRRLLSLAESPRDKHNAWHGLMQIAIKENGYSDIIKYADLIIDQANINTLAITDAYLQKGLAYFNQGKYEQARPAFKQAIATAKDENAANSKYMIGLMQYNEQEYQASLKTLFELNDSYAAFNRWIGKSFLLIADNYYTLGEVFQAKATLNSIIENAENVRLVDEAKIKLGLILEKEKAVNKADSLLNASDSVVNEIDSLND